MTCPICIRMSVEEKARVEHSFLAGKTIEQIGIDFGTDYDEIRHHCMICIRPPRSRYERSISLIKDVEDVMDASKQTALEDPGNANIQQAYARLVSEYRSILGEHEELRKPEDVVRDLAIRLINPFIREMMKTYTEELSLMKADMTQAGISRDVTDRITKGSFKRYGERMKQMLEYAVGQLNTYFGAKTEVADLQAPVPAKQEDPETKPALH